MLTSRRKRPLSRESANRDARLIVVATEGEHTERIYLEAFTSRRVQIVTLPTDDCKSSPADVAKRIAAYKDEYQVGEGDEFWIVVDRDAWNEGALSSIAEDCSKDETKWLAVSNPCFEVWLALHFTNEIPEDLKSKNSAKFLRKHLAGYKKSSFKVDELVKNVADAINRARDRDVPSDRWPNKVGSRVYLLMESILRK